MKQHMRHMWKLLGERIFFNIITVIMLPVFLPIIDTFSDANTFTGTGPVIFSLMVCSLYLGIAFDMIWKMGRHDRQSYATEKHYRLKGLVVGLLSEIPFLIFYLLFLLFPGMFPFYRIICIGVYMGFLPATLPTRSRLDPELSGYGLVLLILPVFTALGYIVGYKKPKDETKKLSFKLMYKNKKS